MKISTKGRYAITVLIDLSKNKSQGYISLKEIAERQDISIKYLEKIMKILVDADYLLVLRGKQGGYKLAKNEKEYILGDILRLTEKNIESSISCILNPESCNKTTCKTKQFWKGLDDVISNYLNTNTLQDLL